MNMKINQTEPTLDDLGDGVKWLGDNLGAGAAEPIITMVDKSGLHVYVSPNELLAHPVWARLDDYSRRRINEGLEAIEQDLNRCNVV